MSEKIQKLKLKALKKIAGSQISDSEAEKIKKLIPTTKDSESVFEAKKNSLLKKMDNMKVGGAMLKKIPEGPKGEGLRKLKAERPDVTRKMGFAKKGKMAKAKKGMSVKGKMTKARTGKMIKANVGMAAKKVREKNMMKASMGASVRGFGAARTSGMGLQDEQLIPGKSLDYYKDLM